MKTVIFFSPPLTTSHLQLFFERGRYQLLIPTREIYEIHQVEVKTKRFIKINFQNQKDLFNQFDKSKYFFEIKVSQITFFLQNVFISISF